MDRENPNKPRFLITIRRWARLNVTPIRKSRLSRTGGKKGCNRKTPYCIKYIVYNLTSSWRDLRPNVRIWTPNQVFITTENSKGRKVWFVRGFVANVFRAEHVLILNCTLASSSKYYDPISKERC